VNSNYPTCPKCRALPMRSIGLWTGEEEISIDQYMCGSALADETGAVIERLECFKRQRNQAVEALEWAMNELLGNGDEEADYSAGQDAALTTLKRLKGCAK
jgi:hypothetical protein